MTPGSRRTEAPATEQEQQRGLGLTGLVAIAVMTTVLLLLAPAPAADAQQGDDAPPAAPGPSVRILAQTTHVAAAGIFTAELAIDVPGAAVDPSGRTPDFYTVSTTLFGLMDDPDLVGRDEAFAQPLNRLDGIALDTLPMTAPGRYRLEIPVRSGPPFDGLDRTLLPFAGVYPLSVELRTEEGPVASDRSYLIRLPAAGSVPDPGSESHPSDRQLTVLLPIGDATAGSDGGEAGRNGGRLDDDPEGVTVAQATELAAAHPDVPLVALLSPGALDTLRDDPDAAAALAAAMAGRRALARPTLDLDPSALAEIDHGHLYHQILRGLDTELTAMGLRTEPTAAVLDAPLTAAGVDVMTTAGVTVVVDPGDRAVTTSAVHRSGDAHLTTVGFGTEATRLLGDHGAPALLAHLALDHQARATGQGRAGPSRSGVTAGVTAVVGPGAGPDVADELAALLASLTEPGAPGVMAPLRTGGGLGFAPVSAGGAVVEGRLQERPQQDLTSIGDLLVETEALLATYERFHGGRGADRGASSSAAGGIGRGADRGIGRGAGGDEPSIHRHAILDGLGRDRSPEQREAALSSVRRQLVDDLAVIDLADGQPVTMAAREATIPVIVESRADGPRTVMLRIRSDKVSAADDGRILVIEPGTSSIDVDLEARSLGASPLRVSVLTPDGQTTLATSQFQIRSTAVPGPGLLVSAAALACLVAWWVADARKRRRGPTPGAAFAV